MASELLHVQAGTKKLFPGTVALDWAIAIDHTDISRSYNANTAVLLIICGLTGGSHESYIKNLIVATQRQQLLQKQQKKRQKKQRQKKQRQKKQRQKVHNNNDKEEKEQKQQKKKENKKNECDDCLSMRCVVFNARGCGNSVLTVCFCLFLFV